jgi:hypothetical protein
MVFLELVFIIIKNKIQPYPYINPFLTKGRFFMKSQSYSHQDLVRIAKFTPDDFARIGECRQDHTRLGFAYQLAFVRKNHSIPTACPYFTHTTGPRGDGLFAASEAATLLGVPGSMVAYWFRQGLIVGQQRRPRTALWVRLSDADRQRWDGSAQLQEDMIPLPEVPRALGFTSEQMRIEIQAGRLLTYRLRVENRCAGMFGRLPSYQLSYLNHKEVHYATHAGLRVGELVSLIMDDVTRSERKGAIQVRAEVAKGEKERAVPVYLLRERPT